MKAFTLKMAASATEGISGLPCTRHTCWPHNHVSQFRTITFLLSVHPVGSVSLENPSRSRCL